MHSVTVQKHARPPNLRGPGPSTTAPPTALQCHALCTMPCFYGIITLAAPRTPLATQTAAEHLGLVVHFQAPGSSARKPPYVS